MATSVIHNEEQGVIGINSLDELISSSDHMVAFRTNQNIPIGTGGIVLEAYARGVFVGGTTGCLMAVGYGAAFYTAFYTAGQWQNAKKFT